MKRSNNGGCLGLILLVSLVVSGASLLGLDSASKTATATHTTPSVVEEAYDPHSPLFYRLKRAAKHLPPGASYEAIVEQAQREASSSGR